MAAGAAGAAELLVARNPLFPQRLSDTGLYAPGEPGVVSADVVSFTPQYPLWSDGAAKRRWLRLPARRFIDASDPDAWKFPPGTRLWKEFSHGGRPVETRLIERRADGAWQFAAYVWNEAGTDAELVPAAGLAAVAVPQAPGGRYAIPSRTDCLACHGSTAVPVLGLSALQLSPDRDPSAARGAGPMPGDVDLRGLVERGWLRRLPAAVLEHPPRIAADTPVERAALGYLHGNCAHCHNTSGLQAPVGLTLAQSVAQPRASRAASLASAVDAPSRYRPPGSREEARVVVPGQAQDSVLVQRMQTRDPRSRMPPLGTAEPDTEGLALLTRWIRDDLSPHPQKTPQKPPEEPRP